MGRLENLSVQLAYRLNDSRIEGGNEPITMAVQDGNRFTAQDRLNALNNARVQVDTFSRMNIATAIQNELSFQSPFRITRLFLKEGVDGVRDDVQVVLRVEALEETRRFRQVTADVLDEYKTVGYTLRDAYPDGVFTISVFLTNNTEPSTTDFSYRAFVKQVDSITLTGFPTRKYAKVSASVFDDVSRRVRSVASENELKSYEGIYSGAGQFSNGVFTPSSSNFNPSRVYETLLFRSETKPTTEFFKVPMNVLRDFQNNAFSDELFESLKARLGFHKVTGTLVNGEFVPSDPNFSFRYVKEVTGLRGAFNAIQADWREVVKLQQGLRPMFAEVYKNAYGKYTVQADIVNGALVFRDSDFTYRTHVADVVGIKSQSFYEDGGEKFRKVAFRTLREYQNGTAPLQNPNALPDGRTDDYLFATQDDGVGFYPKDISVPNVFVEYLGIPPAKIFGYEKESFKVFPTQASESLVTLEYFGFSPNAVFYAESFASEITFNVFPTNYSGEVTITYRGLPLDIEMFTADADSIRFTGNVDGAGRMTYVGKPPAVVYAFRNGRFETFPELNLGFVDESDSPTHVAVVQTNHPPLAYNTEPNSQGLEYPESFDGIVLDFASAYLYYENGDMDIGQVFEQKAKGALAEWIGLANVAVGGARAKGGERG